MRYWDASALVPVCVEEQASAACRRAAAAGRIVTWCLSSVEVASVIERQAREGLLDPPGRVAALRNLEIIRHAWAEVAALAAIRERAQRLLAVHPLRAADSLQLAAALVAAADQPSRHEFFSLDVRLVDAAAREGFRLGAL